MKNYIKDKVILITGASRGIGRAAALLFVENGATVVAMARNKAELLELQKEAASDNLHIMVGDVSNQDNCKSVVESTLDRFGSIDFFVNNAGYGVFKNVEDIETTEWEDLMDVNLKGTFLMTKNILPSMKKQKSGHILIIASDVAKRTFAGGSLYTASKYGQEAFAGALRKEVRADNIKVSVIYSGLVDSHFHNKPGAESSKNWLKNQDMAASFLYVLNQPPHVVIDELMIHPLEQEY